MELNSCCDRDEASTERTTSVIRYSDIHARPLQPVDSCRHRIQAAGGHSWRFEFYGHLKTTRQFVNITCLRTAGGRTVAQTERPCKGECLKGPCRGQVTLWNCRQEEGRKATLRVEDPHLRRNRENQQSRSTESFRSALNRDEWAIFIWVSVRLSRITRPLSQFLTAVACILSGVHVKRIALMTVIIHQHTKENCNCQTWYI